MRRFLIGAAAVLVIAAAAVTFLFGYLLIEDLSGPAQIGAPTYKLETFEP